MEFTKLTVGGKDILVSNDYWMENNIRTPVDLTRAFQIADSLGMYLPTKEIVDAVHRAAHTLLDPIPMTPGPRMTSLEYFERHNQLIEDQLKSMPKPYGLIAGHLRRRGQ